MKRTKTSKAWMQEHVNDPYVKLAQKDGYRARAAYKLLEIDDKDRLIKPGMVIVDLGSTPGSWSQVAIQRLKGNGRVIALDLLPMVGIPGVDFIQGDFREEDVLKHLEAALAGRQAQVVVSDMAPNLSGIASADAARVENLVELALEFAQTHLVSNGALVAKVFHGGSYNTLVQRFKETFSVVKTFKPKASRDRSSETFLVGIGLRN